MRQPSRARHGGRATGRGRERGHLCGSRAGAASSETLARGAWAAWGTGAGVYVFAVTQRTSLGVAGLDASERFGISASALSVFPVFQVLVYAVAQIPVGLAIDRRGPRKVLATGLVLLITGQLGFAFADNYPSALVSRTVLGCGDAMIFTSVLRLVSNWFPPHRNPFISQLAGLVGTLGNLLAVTALARLLPVFGWTATFAATGLPGFAALAVVLLFLRESPRAHTPARGLRQLRRPLWRRTGGTAVGRERSGPAPLHPEAGSVRSQSLTSQVRTAWGEPGTRLGMWVHFTTSCWANPFLLLWGLPYLVEGQGLSRSEAGSVLGLVVVSGMGFSLLFGQLVSRRPAARTPLTLAVVLSTCSLWAAVLGTPPGHVPWWLLVALAAAMGSNGPASLVGLDYSRPVNPPARAATATGMVVMGGFTATIFVILGVGAALDRLTPAGFSGYSPSAYRTAFLVPFVLTALGLVQILRLHGRAARREEEITPGSPGESSAPSSHTAPEGPAGSGPAG
ncbi:MFS transporter [Streptomyces sp. NPDC049954]|uniref:MFS transporter n=1 Tax=Streptomyces sp. NPDC049954 TaxID=3155779 RepID=UPI00343D93FA